MANMAFMLQGGKALWSEQLDQRDICVADAILQDSPTGPVIDASGYVILPGIVDIHGDGFERHVAPRRGAVKDLSLRLRKTEHELASNGITTAVLAQFYSWEGGMRGPDFACDMLEAIDEVAPTLATDIRVQLRFEYLMQDHWDRVLGLVTKHKIPYVVLNDHVPHSALSRGKKPPRLVGQALKSRRNPETHLELLKALHEGKEDVLSALPRLVQALLEQKVLIGSHDDATAETRGFFHALGVTVSEFPETREAADCAHELGSAIIMGAPNMLRGGSHTGNLNAKDILGQGLDALASDYHYPAPLQCALRLSHDIGLAPAWALVSKNPARLLGLEDRGILELGCRADMVILREEDHALEATIANGRFTHVTGDFASRLLSAA